MFNRIQQYLMPCGGRWHVDCLSGLTVALALVPEAIAFALVAHVDPLVGLFSAFCLCLITALVGGRPGMISGATGSMAVVIVSLVTQHGLQYLFATIVLTGVLQLLVGVFRWGKLIRILPKPVMVGFVNGLAIVIFLAQLEQFKVRTVLGGSHWLQGHAMVLMVALVALAMVITYVLPKCFKQVPSALMAIVVVTALVHGFHLETRVVDDMMVGHSLSVSLPVFAWFHVPLSLKTVTIVLPYAVILCIIGLSESLMTLSLIDEMTQTRGRANRECIAQGLANVISGFFQGMGGCAMIGQSMINVNSGGRGRLSGIVAGVALILFVLVFWSGIKMIPLAALVGVMFMVVISTFEWATFKFIRKIPKHDALVIVVVTAVTVFTDLAIAVVVGVIIAALVFAWETANDIWAEKSVNSRGVKEYKIHGPLFFGSVMQFKGLFEIEQDPDEVVIDFARSRVADHSAIDAIQAIAERYLSLGKAIHLRHLSAECKALLGKAGNMVEVNVLEDPDYHVATDQLSSI